MNSLPKIVIVEDNRMYREYLVQFFKQIGQYEVLDFENGEACIAGLENAPSAYLLDQELSPSSSESMSGLELLKALRKKGLGAPALFLTEHPKVQPAAEIMKGGAFDYMRKEYNDLSSVGVRIQQMVNWQLAEKRIKHLDQRGRRLRRKTMYLIGLFLIVLGASILW